VDRVAELGMESIALTDHGVLFGGVDFYRACRKKGLKPIIGCEVYVAPRRLENKEGKKDTNPFHLVLLAKNNEGYQNLMKIVSKGFVDGFYYKPRVDHDFLKKHSNGLIALSACIAGEIPNAILNNNYKKATELCGTYQEIFGEENFYLEIQNHKMPEEIKVNEKLIEFSNDYNIPLVATNDVHYINKEDAVPHDVLLCVQTGSTINDEKRMKFPNEEFYLKSSDEMSALFQDVPDAISNTVKIAEQCKVTFDLESNHLPQYRLPEGETSLSYLRKLCKNGLSNKYSIITDEIAQRLSTELEVISNMGFEDYFLIVWDFIKYAKEKDIMVGPGRGSAAGSIVAYALDITTIDPLKYNLIFERFLNPERITMPDIDIDFCYERRQEVIDYTIETYGSDHVAQIITFGTMAARAAIRDVGRALDMSYQSVDRVAKQIPIRAGAHIKIEEAIQTNDQLKKMYENEGEVRYLLDTAKTMEGLVRHASTHAAGVVISDKPLVEYVPLYRNGDMITTQFPMTLLEDLGLLKMDFLGLRTLTVIRDAINNIRISQGKIVDIDNLNLEDDKVYEMISKGDTLGVFQLESSGMQSFMKELKPENFEDIIAGISLYRPGPMDQIPTYVNNKNNDVEIKYIHPVLEPILNVTYGCIVYQEQVMQIVRDVAGYSMGRSDLVRRAMSKKKIDVMEKERHIFIYGDDGECGECVDGAIKRGVPKQAAEKIYNQMIDFAKYAFNKSHAAAYAMIAFQTAWLKFYYPKEFMAALLTSVMDSEKKVAKYIEDCRKLKIKIVPPDANISEYTFIVRENCIRYGLGAIKNLGRSAIEGILEERRKKGDFTSFHNFIERISDTPVNKRGIESLIKSGAFDFTTISRGHLLNTYEETINQVNYIKKDTICGQMSLLDRLNHEESNQETAYLNTLANDHEEVRLAYEKEVLGLYLSGHPLEKYKSIINKKITLNSSMVDDINVLMEHNIYSGKTVTVGGMVYSKSDKMTKNQKLMCFVTIEDLFGKIEIVVFPESYQRYRQMLNIDQPVLISGKINYNEETTPSIICDKVSQLDVESQKSNKLKEKSTKTKKTPQKLVILLNNRIQLQNLNSLKSILKKNPGDVPVTLYVTEEKKGYKGGSHLNVEVSESLLMELEGILGKEKVVLKY
jgi:DNA polymerase-3 subunit alpha